MNEADQRVYVTVREAARLTGLESQTIRKMADNSSLVCYRTPSQQRRILVQSLEDMCRPSSSPEGVAKTPEVQRDRFIYARVSTQKQVDDLSRQVEFIQQFDGSRYASHRVVTDIASGINFKRKGLQTLLDSCLSRNLEEVVVAHRDRLCRFGFDLLEQLVTRAGGKITVLTNQEHKTCEQELADDLLSIIHVFSYRQMGKRSYSTRKAKNIKIANPSESSPKEIA